MNTATTLLNGVTLTAAAEIAAGAASTDLNAITANDIILEVTAVNGGTSPGNGKSVDVFVGWASSSVSTNIPAAVGPTAERIQVQLSPIASETRVVMSVPTVKKARYAYAWYTHEALNATVTLTVKVIS